MQAVGIVRLVIHQAKDLDASKSLAGELNPFAVVVLGSNPVPIHSTQSTRHTKHTNNPIWESATEFLCSDKDTSIISVKVIDDRDFLKDPLVGYLSIRLVDLLQAQKETGRDWWPLSGCKTGRVRMSAEWKALNITGNLQGTHQYSPPIGVVKLFMDKATDVK
jgi:Ca2+-dependent lipid-binding protein